MTRRPVHGRLRACLTLADPRFLDDRTAHWAETKPDDEAFIYFDRTWTWAQWNDRVRRLAGALKERGVKRGDVVAFLDKNHPACVELTLAAASLGAANAIINFRLAADELDYVLNDSGAKLLIVGKELKGNVDKIRDKLTNVERRHRGHPRGRGRRRVRGDAGRGDADRARRRRRTRRRRASSCTRRARRAGPRACC